MRLLEKFRNSFSAVKKVWNDSSDKTIRMSEIIDLFSVNGGGEYGEDLGEITYFICLKVLSESIGKIPLYLLDSEKRRIREHDTTKIFGVSANQWQTPAQFF